MANNIIQSRSFRGVTGDKWLLKLEKKAFGWHFWGTETEDEVGFEISSDGRSGKVTHKYIQWMEFRRQAPFTGNILFKLSEILNRIFSFFRRLLISIGVPIFAIALILGLVCRYGCNEADMGTVCLQVAMFLAIAYAVCVGITLIFAAFGLLWRKVFGIDKKLKKIYGDDLSDCRFKDEA